MSLLSVHMGLENLCQQRIPSLNPDNMDKQEGSVATGGRCFTLVRGPEVRRKYLRTKAQQFLLLKVCECNRPQSGKPEPQTMEGTLERKQKLQLGGKKVRKVPLSVKK